MHDQQSSFRHAVRVIDGPLARIEKRCLIWLATRMPAAVNSDHLTALGAVAMLLAGVCFWIASWTPLALPLVVLCLAANWFGDSLDGTLARVRAQERPRYGFYVDHVLDAAGALFLFGGMALSGYMSPPIAMGMLLAYYLMMIEICLAAYTVGRFQISYFRFGPTELRILLSIGALVLMVHPDVVMFGQPMKLFDVGGAVGIVGIGLAFLVQAIRHTRLLYQEESLNQRSRERISS